MNPDEDNVPYGMHWYRGLIHGFNYVNRLANVCLVYTIQSITLEQLPKPQPPPAIPDLPKPEQERGHSAETGAYIHQK